MTEKQTSKTLFSNLIKVDFKGIFSDYAIYFADLFVAIMTPRIVFLFEFLSLS